MSRLPDAARAYIDTRFRHRGRNARGLDCAGLVWAAYNDLGVTLPDFRLYGPEPHQDGLTRHVEAALGGDVAVAPVAAGQLQPGDVIVLRFEREPHHVAIVGDHDYAGTRALTVIHACGMNGRVLEQRLTPDMTARITHVYRRPI